VIKRLVRDLNMPVRIEVCPTVREPDGLALSSRNSSLSESGRSRATALYRALQTAADRIGGGERNPVTVRKAAEQLLTSTPGIELEYFELVDPQTLAPIQILDGDVLAVVAARVGATRLIDNQPIRVPPTQTEARTRSATTDTRTPSTRAAAESTHQQEALACSERC
jgi:pantoate--beta-alanine ligase